MYSEIEEKLGQKPPQINLAIDRAIVLCSQAKIKLGIIKEEIGLTASIDYVLADLNKINNILHKELIQE